jgi:pimeloyl-ACP methyl ester carboxylesterase
VHHVLEWNGDAKRTAFLLHGYLDQAQSLVPIGDALAAMGWRVFAPDFRGHGRSGWVPDGAYYHFPDYVADLDALVDELAPESEAGPIAIVAHSMGGTVATMFTGVHPARVRSLVLMEGMGPPAMPPDALPLRVERWLDQLKKPRVRERRKLATVGEAIERLRMTHGGQVPEEVLARIAPELIEPHPSGEGFTWRFDPLHQTTSPGRFDVDAFAAFAQRVTSPVLLVDGGDTGFRHADDERRRAWFADRREVTLAGAGHMMHWTRPADLAGVVVAFVTKQPPPNS